MYNINKVQAEYRKLLKEYCSGMASHFSEKLFSICVFGSVAKGMAAPESDIDVLVVAEGLPTEIGLRVKETNYIHIRLKKTEPYRSLRKAGRCALISDIFLTPSEVKRHPPILLDMIDEGIILYDKDDFLRNTLRLLKNKLKALGARKIVSAKGHYWILKPDIKPSEVVEI
jgi:hypothetical protein